MVLVTTNHPSKSIPNLNLEYKQKKENGLQQVRDGEWRRARLQLEVLHMSRASRGPPARGQLWQALLQTLRQEAWEKPVFLSTLQEDAAVLQRQEK